MTDSGDLREDLKLPEGDLGLQLQTEFDSGKDIIVSIDFKIISFNLIYMFMFIFFFSVLC